MSGANETQIRLAFNLPYQLGVEGLYTVKTMGETFLVELTTHMDAHPRFPGAETLENVAIVDDDTNILGYTKVVAHYLPGDAASAVDDGPLYSKNVENIARSIANKLVIGVRQANNDFIKDPIYHVKRLGPIDFRVPAMNGNKGFSGTFDGLMGGITIAQPPKSGADAQGFADIVGSEAQITVSKELYFDARRFLVHHAARMALSNLVISFEVGLADVLARIAVFRGDTALETEILNATIGPLGTQLARRTMGASFERESFWGERFSSVYKWLRTSRNKVLHRAQLVISEDSQTKDFNDIVTLESLFDDHDWLVGEIEVASSRVLQGLPARQ